MDIDTSDEHERPTLRCPTWRAFRTPAAQGLAFDSETERFFLAGDGAFDETVTLDASGEDEEVTEWWAEQRRRALSRFVAATMAVCVCLLAAGMTLSR